MSHFAVLVVGDVEHNLAPFHEFECTGIDNEFVQDIDQTDEARADYEKHKDDPEYPSFASFVSEWYGWSTVPFGAEPDTSGEHKYGYAMLDDAGEIAKVIKRTNPNEKWDWFVEGGRWSGQLLTKDGRRVDSAKKADIDFDSMRQEADNWRREEYKDAGYNPSLTWRPWGEVRGDASLSIIEEKHKFYDSQPDLVAVKANYRAAERDDFMVSYDAFLGRTADEYVDAMSSRGINTYAIVKDRQWHAWGEMGWFGMSSDDIDRKSWADQLLEAIRALPDDVTLTVVDCHI